MRRKIPLTLLLVLSFSASADAQLIDLLRQAQQHILQGDLASARSVLAEASQSAPEDERVYNLLGVVDVQQGNYAAAESHFTKAIELNPRFTGAYLNLGRFYQENRAGAPDAIPKAIATYGRLLAFQSEHPEANYQMARLLYHQGDYAKALDHLSRLPAPKGQEASVEMLLELAQTARQQGNHQGALAYLAQARDIQPDNARVHFFFGVECLELGLAVEAYESLEKAVELDPDNAYSHYALGGVALRWKDPSEAAVHFQTYRRLKPEDPRGDLALATAFYYAARYDEAEALFQELTRYEPTAASAYHFLGLLAKDRNQLAEAQTYFEKSLDIYPENPDGHAQLGVVLLAQKNYTKAESALARALAIDSEHYLANFNLLLLYRRTGDPRAEQQSARLESLRQKRTEETESSLRRIQIIRPPDMLPGP